MTRKKSPPTTSLVRSSAAEYLAFVAATGSQEQSVETRYEDERSGRLKSGRSALMPASLEQTP
ncbi:MAG: hypothetical protein R3B13_10665 [Polyangiaceae bacterium]